MQCTELSLMNRPSGKSYCSKKRHCYMKSDDTKFIRCQRLPPEILTQQVQMRHVLSVHTVYSPVSVHVLSHHQSSKSKDSRLQQIHCFTF